MDNLGIDARARGGWKRRSTAVLMWIVLEQRLSAAAAEMLGHHSVDFRGRNTRNNDPAYQIMRLPNAYAGLAHQGNLAVRFELNHVALENEAGIRAGSGDPRPATDTTRYQSTKNAARRRMSQERRVHRHLDAGENVVGGALPSDRSQNSPLAIVLEQRLGQPRVLPKSFVDGVMLVVHPAACQQSLDQ